MEGINKTIRFDVGIERSSSMEGSASLSLPKETNRLMPSDKSISSHFQKHFHHPSLTADVLLSLQPDIRDRSILTPGIYHEMLASIKDQLKKKLSSTSESSDDSELQLSINVLEETIANLDEFKDIKSLLIRS